MSRIQSLTREERREIDKVLKSRMKAIKVAYDIDQAVLRWARFVEDVEQGYPLAIDDYINELDWRDLLEEVLVALPDPIKSKIREALSPWDERFLKSTRPIDRPLRPRGAASSWWNRIPNNLTDSLRRYLKDMRFI